MRFLKCTQRALLYKGIHGILIYIVWLGVMILVHSIEVNSCYKSSSPSLSSSSCAFRARGRARFSLIFAWRNYQGWKKSSLRTRSGFLSFFLFLTLYLPYVSSSSFPLFFSSSSFLFALRFNEAVRACARFDINVHEFTSIYVFA